MSTNNESSSSNKMNQTLSASYDQQGKTTNLQLDHNFKSSQQQNFISNIQNVSQNLQNFRPANSSRQQQSNSVQQIIKTDDRSMENNREQLKIDLSPSISRALNINQKSMISPEIHTHFKKQKIQNLKNEEDYLHSATSLTHQLNSSTECGAFSQITQQYQQQNQQLTNQFNEQLMNNSQSNRKPQNNYSESLSSDSSSDQCSFEPNDQLNHQFPINLIKGNQDTSSSSSTETKDEIQFLRDAKLDCSTNSSTNSSLYSTLISPVNQKLPTQSSNNSSSSNQPSVFDNIELVFTKQPAKYHRARYMTEGSRGPIRDKSGKGFPTIKLKGYSNRPVKAYCYLIDAIQINQPHLFYQASKLTSRCLTNCVEIKFGNTIALEFELHPRNDMELMIDCLGIVKQRLFEIQQQQHNQEKSHFKTPYCRLAFECYIGEYNHIVKTWSDTIHCKQMMRAPEIHRMSIKESNVLGEKEMFIIGKNFTKDLKLYFSYGNQWQEQVTPVKELFHQAHIVCNIPKIDLQVVNSFGKTCTDKDGRTTKRLIVELYAVCDNKMSGKEQFTYYL